MWGPIGLLGLVSTDLDKLKEFRNFAKDMMIGDRIFLLYPKDGLIRKHNLSALLRDDLKSYDLKTLTKALFYRNRGLRNEHGKCNIQHCSLH
jgi:hypothetical protein